MTKQPRFKTRDAKLIKPIGGLYQSTDKEGRTPERDKRYAVLRKMKTFTPEEIIATGLFGPTPVSAVKYLEYYGYIEPAKTKRRRKAA